MLIVYIYVHICKYVYINAGHKFLCTKEKKETVNKGRSFLYVTLNDFPLTIRISFRVLFESFNLFAFTEIAHESVYATLYLEGPKWCWNEYVQNFGFSTMPYEIYTVEST